MTSPNTGSTKRRIDWLLNIAIIVMLSVIGVTLIRKSLSSPPAAPAIAPTARIFIKGLDWAKAEQTLLIAVRRNCEYCSKSGRFYRRLLEGLKGRNDIRAVAIYPDEPAQGEAYLGELGLTSIEQRHETLAPLGIQLVPTLALVDKNGVVSRVWTGELSPKRESEVMTALQLKDTRPVSEWTMSEAELKRRSEAHEALIVLDVRGREAYSSGHLEGAKNIPWDEIYTRAKDELPQDQTIVLYSNDEIQADVAYTNLFKAGYDKLFIYTPNAVAP